MTTYDVAYGPRINTTHWQQLDAMTWPALVEWLGLDAPATRKDCGGYVLGRLRGGRRNKGSVVSRSAITLDVDFATESLRVDAYLALDECAMVAHTTWSHTPDAPHYRLIIPLSEPVNPDEYRLIAAALIEALGADQVDPTTTQPERLMLLPSDQGHYEQHVFDGPPLDVARWLAPVAEPEPDDAGAPEEWRPPPPLHPYAHAAIQRNLEKLQACADEGWGTQWNNTTYEVACNLVEFANSPWTGYTLQEAEQNLLDCAPTDPGFGRKEHLACWQSALAKVGGNGRPDPDGSPEDDFSPVEPSAQAPDKPAGYAGPFQRTSLHALLDPDRPPREYVVEPFIAASTSVALIAPAGHKKSLLALALALAVARGDDEFAGMPIPRARRVLYVDMELTEDDLAERLVSFGVQPDDDLERLTLVSLPSMEPLDTAKGGADLIEAVDHYGLAPGDLVVLDSYQRVTEAGENDSDTTRGYYRHTGVRLKERGLTVIRTDNTGKDASKGARGSSGKRDDVDVEYLLKSDGNYIEITTGKVRQRTVSEVLLTLVTDTDGRTTFRSDVPSPQRSRLMDCVAALDALGLPDAASQRAAERALVEASHDVPRNVIRDAVKARKQRETAQDVFGETAD